MFLGSIILTLLLLLFNFEMQMKSAIRINPVVVCFYTLVVLLPEVWLQHSHPWWRLPVGVLTNLGLYAVTAWMLTAAFSFVGAKVGRGVEVFLHALSHCFVLGWALVQAFLMVCFNRRIDAFVVQMIRETTPRESSEFLQTYLLVPGVLILAVGLLLFLMLYVALACRVRRVPALPSSRTWLSCALALWAVVLAHAYFFVGSAEECYRKAAGMPVKSNAFFVLRQSLMQMRDYDEENARCAQTLATLTADAPCSADDPDIVLIIGESFNKYHSSLYGYPLPTSPRLSTLKDKGELIVFNNVIAPSNSTTSSFQYFLSLACVGDSCEWCERPLLPAIMKRNGWNVVYYSNQFCKEEELSQWDASMGFINAPFIEPLMFCERNHRTFDYDMQLLEDYRQQRGRIEKERNNFILFHLLGQHVNACQRFPQAEAFFHAKDIVREDLTEQQRQEVADYDNATRYDDKVVESIISMYADKDAIVIFLSDHGEETYDFRNQHGRTDLNTDTLCGAYHCQLDVPFFIYLSPSYSKKHEEASRLIRQSTERPFSTDRLPFLILDLLGEKSKWADATKSPINPAYNVPQRRPVYGTTHAYESIVNPSSNNCKFSPYETK